MDVQNGEVETGENALNPRHEYGRERYDQNRFFRGDGAHARRNPLPEKNGVTRQSGQRQEPEEQHPWLQPETVLEPALDRISGQGSSQGVKPGEETEKEHLVAHNRQDHTQEGEME